MPRYLFTSDQRITELPSRIQWVANFIQAGNDTSQIQDKSDNNNASTLKFYYNLQPGTDVCRKAGSDPRYAIRNFVKKFQFPNTRTQESLNDSIEDGVFFAPYRSVMSILSIMAEESVNGKCYLSLEEVLFFLFCNKEVYSNPLCDYRKVITDINDARRINGDLGTKISTIIKWPQYQRQSRELFKVLTFASSCYTISGGNICFSTRAPEYVLDKDYINEVIKYNWIWFPNNPVDFDSSNLEYIQYMDTNNKPIKVYEFKHSTPNLKHLDENLPLQQIFYGAPGTGKSHIIKEQTKDRSVIRTTFHPDSDYSTFVGAYKPTMESRNLQVVPVVVNNGISLQNKVTYEEERIVYRYIKQAFLKAYLGAWKRYADAQSAVSGPLVFNASGALYTVTNVDSAGVSYNKNFTYPLTIKKIGPVWNEVWKSGKFSLPTGRLPGRSLEQAVSQWIKNNVKDCNKDSLEEGLIVLKKEVQNKGFVEVSRGQQKYKIQGNDGHYTVSADSKSTKDTLKKYYSGDDDATTDIKEQIVGKLVEYDDGDFDKAWSQLEKEFKSAVKSQASTNLVQPQFLVIEEINRGNCAQIFGDLFQLLDRGDNGFSEYPIESDTDLQKEIERAFEKDPDYMLVSDIDVEGVIDGYVSNFGSSLSDDIQHGRVMLLPPNLFIWATMNTSDQSLFPIDSAFKRRWEWKYMKIIQGKDESGNDLDWQIIVNDGAGGKVKINGEDSLSWWDFIVKINEIIASMTSSADKQLGYFFCKADDNGIITAETLVNKVVFYLWNDVFKDYGFEDASLFKCKITENGNEVEKFLTFPDFYDEGGKNVNTKALAGFLENVVNWNKNTEGKN